MSFWMFLVLSTLAICEAVFVGGDQDIASPLRVAQCRATCLEKFLSNDAARRDSCLQGPDCFMCWENCELLQSNFQVWGEMCEEKDICFPGCQQACKFHQEALFTTQQTQPVIRTKGEAVIQVSGARAEWPNRPISVEPTVPVVYVVMRKTQTGPWRQIIQTLDSSTRVPMDQAMLRVLVVDPQGLLTIYSPNEENLKKNKKKKKTVNTEIKATTTRRTEADAPWVLKEVSLIHQKVLVIGEIAWDPKTIRGVYLVTWEVDGGGLKGNLFTDSTCVTLSLWPDTIYHIQVELVSRIPGVENIKSQMMDLDTGRAQKVSTETDINVLPDDNSQELKSPLLSVLFSAVKGEKIDKSSKYYKEVIAALMECLLMIVIVIFALIGLRKFWNGYIRRRTNEQKLVEDLNTYPDYPPIVTVLTPSEPSPIESHLHIGQSPNKTDLQV
ncbi:hypothetical protein ABEB36_005087 [Hypothenemus hampei]|uniref:Uncharacterized protein n=1 Tax=Hypothenemus hampei TaxID=57062 RepID=A0ABD1F0T8_HYPHA